MAFYRCGGGTDTSAVTAGAEDVLSPKVIINADGEPIAGTMANQGAKTAALNCGGSYTIPKGYHNGSGKVTANSLASQTQATAAANKITKGYTAWVNGNKVTGTLPVVTVNGAAPTKEMALTEQWASDFFSNNVSFSTCLCDFKADNTLYTSANQYLYTVNNDAVMTQVAYATGGEIIKNIVLDGNNLYNLITYGNAAAGKICWHQKSSGTVYSLKQSYTLPVTYRGNQSEDYLFMDNAKNLYIIGRVIVNNEHKTQICKVTLPEGSTTAVCTVIATLPLHGYITPQYVNGRLYIWGNYYTAINLNPFSIVETVAITSMTEKTHQIYADGELIAIRVGQYGGEVYIYNFNTKVWTRVGKTNAGGRMFIFRGHASIGATDYTTSTRRFLISLKKFFTLN